MAVDNIARGMAAKALENQGGGGSSLPIANTATVGQTIKVAAVDGDGKPTEWEAGNVSWNDLEDKPFGEEVGVIEFTWDGDTTGLESVYANPMTFYKVSDIVLTADQLLGNTFTYLEGENADTVAVDETNLEEDSDGRVFVKHMSMNMVISVPVTLSSEGTTLTPGLWFVDIAAYSVRTSAVTYTGETIKTIDPKYLPAESGGSAEFIVNFTINLEDGSATADKTYEEILEASKTMLVRGVADLGEEGVIFPSFDIVSKEIGAQFSCFKTQSGFKPTLICFRVRASGAIELDMYQSWNVG